MERKQRYYSKLPFRLSDAYTIWDVNLRNDFEFTNDTLIRVFERGHDPTDIYLSSNVVKLVNLAPWFMRGNILRLFYAST